jgi:uncharacterized repeat protein (TIGR01451 family)
MPPFKLSFRRLFLAVFTASLLACASAGPALAATRVNLGAAEAYSVLAPSVTSNGATAMSENLGSFPASVLAGDSPPIVLGETHLGDAQADAAKHSLDLAYGDAVLRESAPMGSVNFAGASFTPGVYGTSDAMGFTASGTMTLDAQGDEDAVFIFQIGGALSMGASAEVKLVGGADACNVFWAVNGATTIGATAKFAGTMMADAGITVGANSRVNGRLLSDDAAITLASTAIRTACAEPQVVQGPPGPAGPAGPAGADGADGADGATGADGGAGAQGETGADGGAGAQGETGADGLDGIQGLTGLTGLMGLTGPTGPTGPAGPTGAADTTTLCVTKSASRRSVRQGGLVRWTIVVKNCGDRAASGVSVTDRLRKGARFKTRAGGSLTPGKRVWQVGTLAAGATRTYRVTTRIWRNARTGRYVNRVRADGNNTPPTTAQGSTKVRFRV